jgi:hypothetical protein
MNQELKPYIITLVILLFVLGGVIFLILLQLSLNMEKKDVDYMKAKSYNFGNSILPVSDTPLNGR